MPYSKRQQQLILKANQNNNISACSANLQLTACMLYICSAQFQCASWCHHAPTMVQPHRFVFSKLNQATAGRIKRRWMRRQQRRYYDSPGFLDAVFGAATQALLPVAWGRSQCARDNFESLELANFTAINIIEMYNCARVVYWDRKFRASM